MMRFEAPWAFPLLLLIPAVFYLRLRFGGSAGFRFSSVRHARAAGHSLRQRLLFVPPALRVLAMVLLVAALARPQQGREQVRDVSEGIAIEMVVDRSSSMQAEMKYRGERLNRLEVVKRVFEEFVHGGGGLEGRPNDLIGMVSFARFANTICPLTLGHGALSRFLESVRLVQRREEDGTAIGDAIALAAARLKTVEEDIARQAENTDERYTIESKVMIVLTDGQNNAGKRHPVEAAKQAAEWGVTIYTIGIGGEGVTTRQSIFGALKMATGAGVDARTLKAVAEATGGRYWEAKDERSLRNIYEEIDALERTEIEAARYVDYRELYLPFVMAALLALVIEIVLSNTVFRKIP